MDPEKRVEENGILVQNRKARHLYDIVDTYEAGMELKGSEVKSLRARHASIAEAYIVPRRGELWVVGMHINPYERVDGWGVNPTRERRLLLHKKEIDRLAGAVSSKGMTIVPLSVYANERGFVKMKIGLARGKAAPDRREDLKKRTVERELAREYSVK